MLLIKQIHLLPNLFWVQFYMPGFTFKALFSLDSTYEKGCLSPLGTCIPVTLHRPMPIESALS